MNLLNEKIIEYISTQNKDLFLLADCNGIIQQSFSKSLDGKSCFSFCADSKDSAALEEQLKALVPFQELPLSMHFPEQPPSLFYVSGRIFYIADICYFFLYFRSMSYYEKTEISRLTIQSYFNIIMQLHDGYVTVYNSDNYRLISANAAYINYMKETLHEDYYTGIPFEKTIYSDSAQYWFEKFEECKSAGYSHFHYLNRLQQALDITMILDNQSGQSVIIVFSKNITREEAYRNELIEINKTLESKVKERTTQLEESYNNLTLFNQIITHEMKTPIREIDAYVGFLLEDTNGILPETSCEDLFSIKNICSEMINCINEFVNYSKVSYTTINPVKINMRELVYSVIEELTILSKGFTISYIVWDIPDYTGDYLMLKLVIKNIIHNSIKFSKPNHINQITVGYMRDEQNTTYYINDRGVGFDLENENSLFEIFKRAHNSNEFEGSGIGLSTVRTIITHHGGTVNILSRKNCGCTVFLTFPNSQITF